MNYPRIAERIFGRPLLITEPAIQSILWVLADRLDINMSRPESFRAPADAQRSENGYRISQGVSIVPVFGKLVQRSSFLDARSGLMSYDSIVDRIESAMNDNSVKAVFGNFDTPGGEAAEAFDAVDYISQFRGRKPMIAMVADMAASAGYALASAFDEVVVTRTGKVGSVGVVAVHRDESQANEKRGLVYTHIFAGAHKVDGSPYMPLSAAAKEDFQAEIDQLYDVFVRTVASNRRLSEDAIRATEARIFTGQGALDIGFADRINSARDELARLQADISSRNRISLANYDTRKSAMNDETKVELTEKQLDGRIDKAKTEGENEGFKVGAEAERARIKAILGSEHADGRDELARHLAFETDMKSETVLGILEKSPKISATLEESDESALTKLTPFEIAMAKHSNAQVKPDATATEENEDSWAKRVAGYSKTRKAG
ncbi:MAG: S49 family peptidase [Woeseia sp.]|nr:S49 family peptidase [Woeseia sp.]